MLDKTMGKKSIYIMTSIKIAIYRAVSYQVPCKIEGT